MEEKLYKIQKPEKSRPLTTDDFARLEAIWRTTTAQNIAERVSAAYLSWDEFRKKSWATEDRNFIWHMVSANRLFARRATPILDQNGMHYAFDPHRHVEFLHQVDLELGGVFLGAKQFSEGDKKQIIKRNLMEEAIASSKLEGANTSRETARRMLVEGRAPRDRSERMIVNNHAAMAKIEAGLKNESMSRELLFDLHRQVTAGTLADTNMEGQLRETLNHKGKRLVIKPWGDETIAYVTPDRAFVEQQLPHFIDFANSDGTGAKFIHPVVKAIMLHFWIGLLHPFEDGNGRLARIIFYWYMLRKGYWAFAYLSLSEFILKSPEQYAMAYVNSEQDDHDLNYFIQYNIEKLQLAREHLQTYLQRRLMEHRKQVLLTRGDAGLNPRQARLLQYLTKDDLRQTSVAAYHRMNDDIGYVTAVNDLKALVEKGYVTKTRRGRNINYSTTGKAQKLFR